MARVSVPLSRSVRKANADFLTGLRPKKNQFNPFFKESVMKASQSAKLRILALVGAGVVLSSLIVCTASAKESVVATPDLVKVCVGVTTCGPIIGGNQTCTTVETCHYS